MLMFCQKNVFRWCPLKLALSHIKRGKSDSPCILCTSCKLAFWLNKSTIITHKRSRKENIWLGRSDLINKESFYKALISRPWGTFTWTPVVWQCRGVTLWSKCVRCWGTQLNILLKGWCWFVLIDGLKIQVNNQDARQIINVCFKLGHRIQLSDHKWKLTSHREMSLPVCCHDSIG